MRSGRADSAAWASASAWLTWVLFAMPVAGTNEPASSTAPMSPAATMASPTAPGAGGRRFGIRMPVQGGPGERGTRLGLCELLGIGGVIERAGEAVGLDVTKRLERDAVAEDLRLAIHIRSAAWHVPNR